MLALLDMVTMRMGQHCLGNGEILILRQLLAESMLDKLIRVELVRACHVNYESVVQTCTYKCSISTANTENPNVGIKRILPRHLHPLLGCGRFCPTRIAVLGKPFEYQRSQHSAGDTVL